VPFRLARWPRAGVADRPAFAYAGIRPSCLLIATAMLVGSLGATRAQTQIPRSPAVPESDTSRHGAVRLGLLAGVSAMVFDEGGDATVLGFSLRAAAGLLSVLDVNAALDLWPSMESYTGWSAQVEAAFYPLGRSVVSPYLLLGLGHFWADYHRSECCDIRGLAHTVAVGVSTAHSGGLGLRLEAVSRLDAGSPNPQLRGLLGLSRPPRARLPGRPEASMSITGMLPVAGPWRLIEPAYTGSVRTPLTQTQGVGLSVTLLHWQIPDPDPDLFRTRQYLWDTRCGLFSLGWWSRVLQGAVSVTAQAGPVAGFMWEGPDYYVRGGAHIDLEATLEAGPVPVGVRVGWLWLIRSPAGGISGSDQHAVLLSTGFRLSPWTR
jgi:hypothetical protein